MARVPAEDAAEQAGRWRRLAEDARAVKTFAAARLDASHLARALRDQQASLPARWRDLGTAALDVAAARGLEPHGAAVAAVAAQRAAEDRAVPARAARDGARSRLEEALAAQRARAQVLGDEAAAARAAQAAAEERLAVVQRDLEAKDARLREIAARLIARAASPASPPTPTAAAVPPPEILRAEDARIRAERAAVAAGWEPAQRRVTEARVVAEAKASECARAEAEHGARRRELETALAEAEKSLGSAQAEATQAAAAADLARESLGRAVGAARLEDPAFAAPLAALRGVEGEVEALGRRITEASGRADRARAGAKRFGWVAGGAAVGLGAIVTLWVVLARGGVAGARTEARTEPGAPPATVSAPPSAGGEPAAANARTGAPADARVTEAVRTAVLGLPSLAAREEGGVVVFRATGAMRVLEATDAPLGARRWKLEVATERRAGAGAPARPGKALVAVLVARDGSVLDVRTLAVGDGDSEELDAILGRGG